MRKIIVTEFISLDGVFQAPGPDGTGFKYEGWTFAYNNDEFMKFKMGELQDADMQLLGRVTYAGFANAWPGRSGDPFSEKFNSMPKYVVSKSLQKAEWNNSHIINQNVVEEIKKLKSGSGGSILVSGSGELVRFLMKNNLVDQLSILLYPVVLGEGKRLFAGAEKKDLKLVESQAFKNGLMKLIYTPKK